jgi:large subunit ribosomal protein L10
MPTERKQIIVEQLSEDLARSTLVVLTDYRGLDVKDMTTVRRNLAKAGMGYRVVKNTLLRLALGEDLAEELSFCLDGPTALALAFEDPLAGAKAVSEQASTHTQLKLKGGWMEGQIFSPEKLRELAALPARPVLLAQLVGTVQAPMAQLVGGLSATLQQLLYVLQQRAEQASAAAPTAEAA